MYIVTEIASVKKMTLLDLFILYFTQTSVRQQFSIENVEMDEITVQINEPKKKRKSEY